MLAALRLTVVALLGSKKFVMAMLTMVAALAAKYGLGFDPAQALAFLSPLIAAIIGQGVADHGKEAAKIMAGAAPSNDNAAPPPQQAAA